jgi:hypothetical protein
VGLSKSKLLKTLTWINKKVTLNLYFVAKFTALIENRYYLTGGIVVDDRLINTGSLMSAINSI